MFTNGRFWVSDGPYADVILANVLTTPIQMAAVAVPRDVATVAIDDVAPPPSPPPATTTNQRPTQNSIFLNCEFKIMVYLSKYYTDNIHHHGFARR